MTASQHSVVCHLLFISIQKRAHKASLQENDIIKIRRHTPVSRIHGCFFFSSRRRHTRCKCDWSSDVCSSDLEEEGLCWVEDLNSSRGTQVNGIEIKGRGKRQLQDSDVILAGQTTLRIELVEAQGRSEERRVGKECRSRWSPYH